MINLLPPDAKAQIRAARNNYMLLRYNFVLLGGFAFLLAALGICYIYLASTRSAAEATIAYNQTKVGDYVSIQTQASTFRQNLANAKQILDNDIAYSKAILEISQVLPPGVVLDTLTLDSKTFGTPTTLGAKVRDYPTALALKDSLQLSKVFSNVSIQSISGGNSGSYPLSVTLNVTIRKETAR